MRSRSSRSRRFFAVGVLAAALAVPVGGVLASLRTSGRIIIPQGEVVAEDVYAIGNRTIVEGVIEGDLFVLTTELVVTGRVLGDVSGVVAGPVRVDGTVGGSVRLAALSVDITGSVVDDVALAAGDVRLSADIGRDVLLWGGEVDVGGTVGRDVRAQAWGLTVIGAVGRDVVARTDDLRVPAGASVAGDLTFKASDIVDVADGVVLGAVSQRRVLSPVWAKAVVRAFAWLSLLGFVAGSVALFWLFRSTSEAAVRTAGERPWRSALAGLAVVVVPPLAFVPLSLTLVGLPVALLLLVAWLSILVLGPAPAVARLGGAMMRDRTVLWRPIAVAGIAAQGIVWVVSQVRDERWLAALGAGAGTAALGVIVWRLMRGRSGIFGAVVIGALAWRATMWVFSFVAVIVYVAALLVGAGSFLLAAWGRRAPDEWRPLPPGAPDPA